MGDGCEGDAGSDFTREADELREHIAQDSQLADTAVLDFGSTVVSELLGCMREMMGELDEG